MTRSVWKGPFFDTIYPLPSRGDTKVWSRRSIILPSLLKQPIRVYNGNRFQSLQIGGNMVGHRFGEFANTRKRAFHKKKQKKKK